MYKKTIALLCAALMLTVLTAACARHSRYGKIIVDSRGMEHVIMTDKNGVTVCDSDGNLIEIVTDRQQKPKAAVTKNGTTSPYQEGEYQTQSITFPNPLIVTKRSVEDQYCKIKLPTGWVSRNDSRIILEHEETGAQITVTTETERMASGILEDIQADCDSLGASYEADETQIDGVPAHILRYQLVETSFTAYVLNLDASHAMSIICIEGKDEQVDFDAVLQTMVIK